jgi:hypothetical protein
VRIFKGKSDGLTPLSNVLVVEDLIGKISAEPIAVPQDVALTRIQGSGRTLMPTRI